MLKATDDRIMATSVDRDRGPGCGARVVRAGAAAVQAAFEQVFANNYSKAVQQTLYEMGEAALAAVPEIGQVRLTLPNRHHITVDFSPFGRRNDNEIFVVLDRPFGLIEGTVGRADGQLNAEAGSPAYQRFQHRAGGRLLADVRPRRWPAGRSPRAAASAGTPTSRPNG